MREMQNVSDFLINNLQIRAFTLGQYGLKDQRALRKILEA